MGAWKNGYQGSSCHLYPCTSYACTGRRVGCRNCECRRAQHAGLLPECIDIDRDRWHEAHLNRARGPTIMMFIFPLLSFSCLALSSRLVLPAYPRYIHLAETQPVANSLRWNVWYPLQSSTDSYSKRAGACCLERLRLVTQAARRPFRKRPQTTELGEIMVHIPSIRRHRQRVHTCIGRGRYARNLKTINRVRLGFTKSPTR